MEKTPERVMLLWNRWFVKDMNRPGKNEHYLMGVMCELARIPPTIFGGKLGDIQPGQFLMKFEVQRPSPELTEEEREARVIRQTNISKASWAGMLGNTPVKEVRISRAEARRRGLIE